MQPDEYGWPDTSPGERQVLQRLREYPCIVGAPERADGGWRVTASPMEAGGVMVMGTGVTREKALVDAATKVGLHSDG